MSLPNSIDTSTRILFCGRMTKESHIQMQQVLRYVYTSNYDDAKGSPGGDDVVTVVANGQKFTIAKRTTQIVPDRDHARIVTPPYNVRILSVEDAAAITQFNDLLDAGATMNVRDFEFWMKSTCNGLLEIMNNIYDVLSKQVILDQEKASRPFEQEVTSQLLDDHESAARRVLFALHELLGPAKLTINTFPFTKLLTEETMRTAIQSSWTDQIDKSVHAEVSGGPSTIYGFAPNSKGLMGSANTGYGLDASHIRKLGCWDTIKRYIPTGDDTPANTAAYYHRNAVFESGDQRFSQEGGGTRYDMMYTNELGEDATIQQVSPSQALATFVATNVRMFCVGLLKNTLEKSVQVKNSQLEYKHGIDLWRKVEMSVEDATNAVKQTLDDLGIPDDKTILSYFFPVDDESNPIAPKDDVWLIDGRIGEEGKGAPLRKMKNTRGVDWKDQGVLSDKDILHLFGLPRPHRREDGGKLVANSADEEERQALTDERLPQITVTVAGGKHEPLQRVLQFISKLFVAPHAIDGATSDLSNVVAVITNYTMPLTYAETMDRSLAWKAAADPTEDLKKQYDGMRKIMGVADEVFRTLVGVQQRGESHRELLMKKLRDQDLLTAFEELWAPTVVMQDGEQDDALAVKFSALILYLKDPLSLAKNFHVTFQLPSNTAIARKTEESDRGKAQDWLLTRTRLMWAMRAGVMNPIIRGRDTPLVRCFLDDQAENMDKIHQNSMWLASKKAGVF